MAELSAIGGFAAGASAACMAVVCTNPIEVIKTRVQLQGELMAKSNAPRVYTGLWQSLKLVGHYEGIRGLQRGLGPAFIYQTCLNGTRVGLYEPIRRRTNDLMGYDPNKQVYGVSIFVATVTGMAGAIFGSPLFLIKTRMQSYSPVFAIGQQTQYRNTWHALKALWSEGGVGALYRGCGAAVLRTGAGSSVQLPIYTAAKHFIENRKLMPDGPPTHLSASVVSGLGVAVVMNPFDVVMTRIYNQKGSMYKGVFDCFYKTVAFEGPTALYKGFVAQGLRVGPHTVLVLTFHEQTSRAVRWFENRGKPLAAA